MELHQIQFILLQQYTPLRDVGKPTLTYIN